MLGQEFHMPVNILVRHLCEEPTGTENVKNLRITLENGYDLAKSYHGINAIDESYKPGDLVQLMGASSRKNVLCYTQSGLAQYW